MEEFYHCPDPALPNASRFLKELFEAFPFPLSDLFFCLLRVPLIIFDDGDFLILQRSPSKKQKTKKETQISGLFIFFLVAPEHRQDDANVV